MSAADDQVPPAAERSPRRGMCAAILSLEGVSLGLTTPVLISVSGVDTSTALWVGLGLAVGCFLLAGMLRGEWAYALGWVLQGVAIGLGFLIPLMFVLGSVFALLWGTAYFLGRKIERERAAGHPGHPEERRVTDHSGEPLSPTERTRLGRLSEKARTDRQELHDLLDTALVAHVGVDAGGYPLVLPTAFAVDRDGPDRDGTLYLHGSVAAKWLVAARHHKVCVTVTEVDGIVAARSGFESSMNYRTAVILGEARVVDDPDERTHALDLMVDHMVPGRAATIRRPTRKELAATQVLAVALWEASLKVRTGGPDDEDDDVADNPWGGHIPLYRVAGEPVGDEGSRGPVPDDVRRRAERARGSLGSCVCSNALWSWSSPTASAGVSPERSSGASRRRATGWCGSSCARRPRSCWRSTTPSTRASRSTGPSSSSCSPGPWPPWSSRANA